MGVTLFTLADLYTSFFTALEHHKNRTAAYMIQQHAIRVDRRRHDSYGIPYALEWSNP